METHSQSIVGLNLASGISCSCQLIWTLLAKGWWIILGWKGVLGPTPISLPPTPFTFCHFFWGGPKIDIEIALKIDVSRAACACFKTWVFMNYPHIKWRIIPRAKIWSALPKKTSRNMSCWKENDHCFLLIWRHPLEHPAKPYFCW